VHWSRKSSSWNFLRVELQNNLSNSDQATNWPHFNFVNSIINPATQRALQPGEQTTGCNSQQVWSDSLSVFSPCTPCVSASHSQALQYPCPKFDIAALLYNIYNAYILKQRSIGATSDVHLFPARVGCKNTHQAPQNPTECWISSKCQWFRYNIKYHAFRWGVGGFELGGELNETGWGGVFMGTALRVRVEYSGWWIKLNRNRLMMLNSIWKLSKGNYTVRMLWCALNSLVNTMTLGSATMCFSG